MGFFDFDWLGDVIGGAKDYVSERSDDFAGLFGAGNAVGPEVADAAGGAGGSLSDAVRTGAAGGDYWSNVYGAEMAKPGGGFYEGVGENAGKLWGGVKGGFQNVGDFARGALPVAQIGLGGLGIANSIKATQQAADNAKIARRGMALQEDAAKPLTDFGKAELANATAGKVPEAVEAGIQRWKAGAMQKVRDLMARMGIPVGTSENSEEIVVEQMAQEMRARWLDTETQRGIQALQGGASAASGVTQSAQHEQGQLDSLIAQANQMLGRLSAGTA